MSILKKYNSEIDQWEPVASNEASGIFTTRKALTQNNGDIVSIEDVLVQNIEDIENLKRNVSWLALHGGGGGGYGSGGSYDFEVKILGQDQTSEITELIWNNDINNLYYKIECRVNTRYTVQIFLDGILIQSENNVKQGIVKSISKSLLNIKKDAKLRIVAYNDQDNSRETILSIQVASITLYPTTVTRTKEQIESTENYLDITFYTSISGNYYLYWSNNPIIRNSSGDILDSSGNISEDKFEISARSGNNQYNVKLSDIGITSNSDVGPYRRYFMLVKSDNNQVISNNQGMLINIVLTNGILVSILNSSETNLIQQNQIYNLRFQVLSGRESTNVFSYVIYISKEDTLEKAMSDENQLIQEDGKIFGNEITYIFNPQTNGIDVGNYNIFVYAFSGVMSNYAKFPITITKSNSNFVTAYEKYIKNDLIFDFSFRNFNINNIINNTITVVNDFYKPLGMEEENSITTIMNLENIGIDSGFFGNSFSFNHMAHANIVLPKNRIFPQSSTDINSLILGSSDQFSFEISYKIKKILSNESVIFKLGNYDPVSNPSGHGILIKPHNYYIAFGGTSFSGILQDNSFSQINITYSRLNSGKRRISIYYNGKNLRAEDVENNQDWITNEGMFLAYDGNDMYNTSCNLELYSLKLYNDILNIGQIVCSFINNYVSANTNVDGTINTSLLNTLLSNNSIIPDEDVTNENSICKIYDFETGEYKWNISYDSSGLRMPDVIRDLPIPKVFITAKSWTYNTFIQSGKGFVSEDNVFKYYPVGESISVDGTVDVEIQGTTTSNYAIKNLDITYRNSLFSPKSDWLPEGKHTLKADVSDSGHINNAVIGKFINDCFNSNKEEIIDASAFPIKSIINQYKEQNKLPQSITPKITIEGFPVMLIIAFDSERQGIYDTRVLGIYSFNLGRDSIYNQGFQIPKVIKSLSGEELTPAQFITPGFFGTLQSQDIDQTYDAYCYEGDQKINNEIEEVDLSERIYQYAIVKSFDNNSTLLNTYRFPQISEQDGYVYAGNILIDSNGNKIPYDSNHVTKYRVLPTGYFWSDDTSYVDNLFSEKYSPNSTESLTDFRTFAAEVAHLEYEKAGYSINEDYQAYRLDKNGESIVIVKKGENDRVSITRPQSDAITPTFSPKNVSFYYVIAMLFGLIDNFGKNMQFKKWKNKLGGSSNQWTPSFYDMDTALGLNNQGAENVPSTMFDFNITNDASGRLVTMFGNPFDSSLDQLPAVYSNKIFGIITNSLINNYTSGLNYECAYSDTWAILRRNYIHEIDQFMNDYFRSHLSGCGELIINYDFHVKYLNTQQINFLHGDRINTIYNWLDERITFLDSIFGYLSSGNSSFSNRYLKEGIYNIPWINEITISHNSGAIQLPITFERPLIVRSNIENIAYYYTYVQKNIPTNIYLGQTLGSSVQTIINNSNCITNIDNLPELRLKSIVPNQISTNILDKEGQIVSSDYGQVGSLSGLRVLDLSDVTTLTSTINFAQLFKTWDNFGLDRESDNSQLQIIKLKNTKISTEGSFNITFNKPNEHYSDNFFENIIQVEASNSDISNINIPSGVSLSNLNISNSNVTSIELQNQPIISELDFNGCNRLNSIILSEIENLKSLSLNSSLINLERISISKCPNLQSIKITADNSYRTLPQISIYGCENLQNIDITDWGQSTQISTIDNYLNLSNNPKLNSINIKGSKFYAIYLDDDELNKLSTFNGTNSTVKIFGNEGETIFNLSKCKRNLNLNLNGNSYVEEINFGDSDFFNITNNSEFYTCTSLNIIRGKLKIDGKTNVFNNTSISNVNQTLTDLELSGTLTSLFASTNCTFDDVKYILSKVLLKTNNLSQLFYNCKNINWPNIFPDNIFEKCIYTSNISSIFSGSYNQNHFIVIPSKTFNPLKNCTSISSAFYNWNTTATFSLNGQSFNRNVSSYVVDRFIFSEINKLANINYFCPFAIVEDSTKYDENNPFNITNTSLTDSSNFGNISGMFKTIVSSSRYDILNNISYINWDSLNEESLGFSSSGTIDLCFRSLYSSGNFDINKIFKIKSNIIYLYSSFTTQYGNVTFNIDNSTFNGFTNLKVIGYKISGDGAINSLPHTGTNVSFGGFNKIINDEFPEDLFTDCKQLLRINGFFANCSVNGVISVKLPGNLFKNCTELTDISYLFYNFQTPYELTSNSFVNCKSLNDVSYLFAASSLDNSRIFGKIPYKLFYHGSNTQNKSVSGYNGSLKEVDANENGVYIKSEDEETITKIIYSNFEKSSNSEKILISPLTKVIEEVSSKENNTIISSNDITPSWEITTHTYKLNIPYKTIQKMEGCFMYANLNEYSMDLDEKIDILIYDTYQPFKYQYLNGRWILGNINLIKYSKIWGYDGTTQNKNEINLPDKINSDGFVEKYENVDDDFARYADGMLTYYKDTQGWTGNDTNYECYIAPPDLLYYCTSSAEVRLLFRNSGVPQTINQYITYKNFGIRGRYCPYMLKPIPATTNFEYMFENCRLVNGYISDQNIIRIIPTKFFSYSTATSLNLQYMFKGIILPSNSNGNTGVNLDVFAQSKTRNLSVAYIFQRLGYFGSNFITISNIFNNSKISQISTLRSAFDLCINSSLEHSGTYTGDAISHSPKIYFENIFGNFDNKSSNQNNDTYVFYGYTNLTGTSDALSGNNVINGRFRNCGPTTDTGRYNYTPII